MKYIAPIEMCAKLREYQKGITNGHKETMDRQGEVGIRAGRFAVSLLRQRAVQRIRHCSRHVLQMA